MSVPVHFTAAHRGGSGPPLVCLHGFMDTWRTWELVLPALERRHEVLAPTLPGHAGGAPLDGPVDTSLMPDAVERMMDAAGIATAHLAGNSLGGFVALQLAARGRARSVVALAPAGGWAVDDPARGELLEFQASLQALVRASAGQADVLLATREGRRRATQLIVEHFEHIPTELLVHQMVGIARCEGAQQLLAYARSASWELDAEAIGCPVRIVWGLADRLLPWPAAAARYRSEWLPAADWVELDDVGHAPQLDAPLVTAELIGRFTS